MIESRLKKILDASPDMFMIIDGKGVLVDYSPSRNFGPIFPPSEFLGRTMNAVLSEELSEAAMIRVREVLETGKESLLEYSLPVEGKQQYYEARFTLLEDSHVLAIVRDVTDQKRSMQAAQALINASADFSLLLDRQGYIMSINDSASRIYGKTPQQMEGTLYWQHLSRGRALVRKERMEQILRSGESTMFLDLSDERIFEVSSYPVPELAGESRYVAFFVKDITDQVQAAQELTESETRHRRLFHQNPVPMYIYDTDTLKILDANTAFVDTYGYTREEITSMTIGDIRPPEDVSKVMENVSDLRSRQVYLGIWRHTKKDGSVIDVEVNSGDFPYQNRPARLVLCSDVTEKLRVEKELAASEDKFRTVFRASPDAMTIHRAGDGLTVDVNETFLDLTGFTRDEVIGKTILEYDVWEDTALRDTFIQELAQHGAVDGLEARFRIRDGSVRYGLVSARRIMIGGEEYYISIVKDITDLKNIETALLQSEKKFRSIVESSPMGIHMYRLDDDGHLIFSGANAAADKMLGLNHRRFESRVMEEVFPASVNTEIPNRYREVCLSGKPWHSEQITYKDAHISGAFEVYAFQTGFRSMSVLFLDVTERKKAMAAIAESEEKFRTAFITSPDSVNINRLEDGAFVDINEGFSQLTGYSREDVMGKTSVDLNIWVDMRDRERLVEGLRRQGSVNNLESKFRMKGGSVRDGLMSATVLNLKGVPHILSITRDISELKKIQEALSQSEEQLRASLGEKEILLKEIHHRVKNNLQVISGLLDLQAHHIPDPAVREVFRESQNRVVTMALIHEELYQSVNLSQVDFADYIRNLCENLMVSYGADRDRIKLEIRTEKTELVVDTAIPCGLIINELITNSLKHAFPGKRCGTISLSFRQLRNKDYQLTVGDDGVGVPRGLDIYSTKTLGMQLVTVMVGQLGGTVKVGRRDGTRFTIRFREYHEAGSILY